MDPRRRPRESISRAGLDRPVCACAPVRAKRIENRVQSRLAQQSSGGKGVDVYGPVGIGLAVDNSEILVPEVCNDV